MNAFCSVLWIGAGRHLPAAALAELPTIDVVWERDVARARALPARFDALVYDADDPDRALAGLALLREGLPEAPIVVRLPPDASERFGELVAAGAARVLARGSEAGSDADGGSVLAMLGGLTAGAPAASPPARARASRTLPRHRFVGDSIALGRVLALVERAARSRVPVLVIGETGTGKELVARAVHDASARRAEPFVAVNCAALPDTLLESELLGHVRGAFTGAERERKGLVEEADGGTLFLDEIGEMTAAFQAKLLRVLQERVVRPLGAPRERRVDVRVVAATHRDLPREVAAARFREDLFYRLAVFPIHLPPLRERPGDVLVLAHHFLSLYGDAEGRAGCALSTESLRLLQAHHWPGNVRELENEIQRAVALADPGEALRPEHFSERLTHALAPLEALPEALPDQTLRESLARIEAWLIRRALERNGGRRAETARRLGLTREGLYKKMQRLGIE